MATRNEWVGVAGKATLITAKKLTKDQDATLAAWLIEAPGQSAAWTQYMVAVIHLRTIEGVRPAHKRYPEAEYEILVAACDPGGKPNPDDFATLRPLRPINFVHQFHGINDEQAAEMCEKFARAVVDGVLPAEFDPGGTWADYWRKTVERTLEHIGRGGHAQREEEKA